MTIIVRYFRTKDGAIATNPGEKVRARPELRWDNDGKGRSWVDEKSGIPYTTPTITFDIEDVKAWRTFLENYVDQDGNCLSRYDENGDLLVYNVFINGGGYKAMKSLFPETKEYAKSGMLRNFNDL